MAVYTDVFDIDIDVGGIIGQKGKSVYELAVENGFSGTEAEFLASLKGSKGDTGEKGEKGDTGTAPEITATKENGVTTLMINGNPVATITDGADGVTITGVTADENGCIHITTSDGQEFVSESVKGASGVTPVRGVDYWTQADVEAVVNAACQAAIEEYPVSEEVEF